MNWNEIERSKNKLCLEHTELISLSLLSLVSLEQRHNVCDLLQLVDVLVPAGGAQRAHHPDDELGQFTYVRELRSPPAAGSGAGPGPPRCGRAGGRGPAETKTEESVEKKEWIIFEVWMEDWGFGTGLLPGSKEPPAPPLWFQRVVWWRVCTTVAPPSTVLPRYPRMLCA